MRNQILNARHSNTVENQFAHTMMKQSQQVYAIPARKILLMFVMSFATFCLFAQMLRNFLG